MADIYSSESGPKGKVKSKLLVEARNEVYHLIANAGSHFGSFIPKPKNFKFETQVEKEEIILLLRRHWVTNLRWIVIVALLLVAPLVLTSFPILSFLPARFQVMAVFMWYLLVIAITLEEFLSWYFNVDIITDERIVDVSFVSLIYKRISDAEIEKIQDVTYKQGGIVQTMFNYGTVYVQTASEKPEFEFNEVPNPALVVKVLERLRIEEKQEELEGVIR